MVQKLLHNGSASRVSGSTIIGSFRCNLVNVRGRLSAKVAKLAAKSATKVVCFAALPFNFEGIKKRKIADDNLALLKEIGVETTEMDNQELFKHINNKTTFNEAFEIYFKKMAQLIGLQT